MQGGRKFVASGLIKSTVESTANYSRRLKNQLEMIVTSRRNLAGHERSLPCVAHLYLTPSRHN